MSNQKRKGGVVFTRHGKTYTDRNFYYDPTKNNGVGELYLAGNLNVDGIIGSNNVWSITGNTGTTNANFLGTTDNNPLLIKTNNIAHLNITTNGQIETLNTGDSVFIGEGAGISDDLSQNNNVFIGKDAGHLNTIGEQNVAVGSIALSSNTTGTFNTAIGMATLQNNTTGVWNTAIGRISLRDNQIGSYNTACGMQTLVFNTTGSYNTATGINALHSNTTGNSNTATGVQALYSNTIGRWNTATGLSSMYNNTSGEFNTANGQLSLYSNQTGSYNTVIGSNAMQRNTTGSNNTVIGYRALYNCGITGTGTTANNNIAIGINSGNSLTSGSNNIYIGNFGNTIESSTIRMGTTGTHSSTFIAGINGVTVSGGISVFINASGQLGTISSSARYKHDINDMGDRTENLAKLRPVTFRYNSQDDDQPVEYGLIAEEVATIYPDLVVYNKDGQPETVQYHKLVPMLLNELKRTNAVIDNLKKETTSVIDNLRNETNTIIEELTKRIALLEQK